MLGLFAIPIALFLLILFLVALSLLGSVFWILMIIDAARRDFKNPNDKLIWIVILIFGNVIGAMVYYYVVKSPRK